MKRVALVLTLLALLCAASAVRVESLSLKQQADIAAEAAKAVEEEPSKEAEEEDLGPDVAEAEKELNNELSDEDDKKEEGESEQKLKGEAKGGKEDDTDVEKELADDEKEVEKGIESGEEDLEKGANETAHEVFDDETSENEEEGKEKKEEAEKKEKKEKKEEEVKEEKKEKEEKEEKENEEKEKKIDEEKVKEEHEDEDEVDKAVAEVTGDDEDKEKEKEKKDEEAPAEKVAVPTEEKADKVIVVKRNKAAEEAAAKEAAAEQRNADEGDAESIKEIEEEAKKEAEAPQPAETEKRVKHTEGHTTEGHATEGNGAEKEILDVVKGIQKEIVAMKEHNDLQDKKLEAVVSEMAGGHGPALRDILQLHDSHGKEATVSVNGGCQDDKECVEGDYCSGLDLEARQESFGTCKKKYPGFCKANPECEAGYICLETSEVEHGLCTSSASLAKEAKKETESGTGGFEQSERVVQPSNLKLGTVDMSERPRPANLKSLRVVEPISFEELDRMPASEVVRGEESCGAMDHHHHHHHDGEHDHEHVHEHVHRAIGVRGMNFMENAGGKGPENWMQCGNDINGVEKCDNPVIRDTYTYDANKRVQIQMYWHFVSPTAGELAKLSDAEKAKFSSAEREKKVAAQLATLNRDYEQAGIVFHGTVAEWEDDELVNVKVENRGCDGQPAECRTFEQFVGKLKAGPGAAPFFETKFNAVVFDTIRPNLMGFALFPWDARPIGAGYLGINENFVGANQKTASHEIGHALGLLHVFRGVKEVGSCSTCYETTPSDLTGDLCEDTAPMPSIFQCAQPTGNDPCTGKPYPTNAPFTNIMSYGPDNCISAFTTNQGSRMRCWVQNAPVLNKYIIHQCRNGNLWNNC